MFSSTIIPTISRPTLSRAVCSVLSQDFTSADFEVIVVNDSGQPLPDAAWQYSERVRIIETNRRERCVARNTGAAIARGNYLHFLDDDDWLLPDALEAFWAVEFFQCVSEAFGHCAGDGVCVGGYRDLSLVRREAEFFECGNGGCGRAGVICCLETYAVCADKGIQ